MKRISQTILISFLAFTLFFAGCTDDNSNLHQSVRDVSTPDGLPQRDAKIYCKATIEDDFDESSLVVILDNLTGGVNKKHDEKIFRRF